MKKIFYIGLIIFGTIVLVSCSNKNKRDENAYNSIEKVYAVSTVTGVNNLKESLIKNVKMDQEENNQNIDFDLMFSIINEDSFKVDKIESDNSEYDNLILINVNSTDTYKMYYNEKILKTEIENDDDEIEEETLYSVQGLIINNDLTYIINGIKTIEKEIEDNEVSEEFELDLKVSIDENKFIKIKYETEMENDEKSKKYIYSVHENNKIVYHFEFEIEDEDDEIELELKMKTSNGLDKYRMTIQKNKEKAILEFGDYNNKEIIILDIIRDENGRIVYTNNK
ncbi:hypothetical protein [Haploplasma axanthum]|uniref:Lipoprotein n=1 Tax=Haploplasma axanthum TaxID=29552 RepID=A0A449BFQ6_HAPAX|nr:hypothetical protein [Haploplasma axanthum]VEU81140.1 Uncharacterised protein [Haploplasma axanthum]